MNAKAESISWHDRARTLEFRTQVFIDGRYRDAASGATFDCINPATGKLLARVAAGDQEDIDRAVISARAAFRKGVWANLAPAKRKKVLLRFAATILEHTEELALLETLDMGKPIADSLKIDIPGAPRGVVGAIVPWNFPLLMAAWKIGPILASGNSLVLKPSEKSPLTALKVAELAVAAGLPPGGLNGGPALGQSAGKTTTQHMALNCLWFSGSTAPGRAIMQYAG